MALKGGKANDKRLTYHYIMKEMGWTWDELMGTPYRVTMNSALVLMVEGGVKTAMNEEAKRNAKVS